MSLWMVRAGSRGSHEDKFVSESKIYITWDNLSYDLTKLKGREELVKILAEIYPDSKALKLRNWVSQLWPFAHSMKIGDWVVLPLKKNPAFYVGEITGEYVFQPEGPNPYYHFRKIKWIGKDIPRTNFAQDLQYSFGAFLTICQVQRNNAEQRLRKMYESGWKPETIKSVVSGGLIDATDDSGTDVETAARAEIARFIMARFKGHELARLVEEILKAQGYTTHRSEPGPDGGVDILASPGPMGFGTPRLCLQVKSEQGAIGHPVFNELKGTMESTQADQGILVAWAGFKPTVKQEIPRSFFKIRLWNQDDIIDQVLAVYDKLPDDLRAELPLKRIWTVSATEDE